MLNGHLDGPIWVWLCSICVPDVGDGTERILSTCAAEIGWAGLQDVEAWDQDLRGSQQNGKTDQEWAAFL